MKKGLVGIGLLLLGIQAFAAGTIDIATVPITINNPGSYQLVKDLKAGPSEVAITIVSSNVSIDFNGHVLSGDTGSATHGIGTLGANQDNISVRNGVIEGFSDYAISLPSSGNQVSNMRINNNTGWGISMGNNAKVEDCTITYNGSTSAAYKAALAVGNHGLIKNNIVSFNKGSGLTMGYGSYATQNQCSSNGTSGISCGEACSVIDNLAANNGVNGIRMTFSGLVSKNQVCDNKGTGIYVEQNVTIADNHISNNATSLPGSGVYVYSGCRVSGNTFSCQTGVGQVGLIVQYTSNQIVQNNFFGNSVGVNFNVATNNYLAQNIFCSNVVSTTGNVPVEDTIDAFKNRIR